MAGFHNPRIQRQTEGGGEAGVEELHWKYVDINYRR
jgi:hypothetical protein